MPEFPTNATPQQLEDIYRAGFPGWNFDQREWDNFLAEDANRFQATDHLRGSGKGKAAYLWQSREKYDPGASGEEAQTTGDCVSHGDRNARDITRSVEIHIGNEPESNFKRGATEPTYGARGHGGQGMSPAVASRFVRDYGWLVRQNYSDLGVDLSRYNARIGINWGRSGVPEAVKEKCKEHNVGSYTIPHSVEDARDLMANGFAGHSGQSWGCSAESNRDGIAITSARWNHDMCVAGMDDTGKIYPAKYGTVFLIWNSWGKWNRQPRVWPEEVLGPWPIGSFWVDEETFDRYFIGSGSIMFYSNLKGFPPQELPDYGTPEGVFG